MSALPVTVEYGDDRLEVAPLGAQLLAAMVRGHPLFFRASSSDRALDAGRPVRGGVPVIFPQFADTGPFTRHGFARVTPFAVEALATVRGEPAIQAQLDDDRVGESYRWPHRARLSLDAQIDDRALILTLTIANADRSAFTFTGGLHPYFAVDDLDDARLHGLDGCMIRDRRGHLPDRIWPADQPLQFGHVGPIDVIATGSPVLMLETGSTTVRLTSSGCSNWVVWNPGAQHDLEDLSGTEWRRFVCVEPAHASAPQTVGSGETARMSLRVDII